MKYITHVLNGPGRHGHKLKDIFTAYIFSYFFNDVQVISHPRWTRNAIIKFTTQPFKVDYTHVIDVAYDKRWWNGISFDMFQTICNKIQNAPDGSLIRLNGIVRVNGKQLTDWYDQGLIKHDIFLNKFIPGIRELYNRGNKIRLKNQLAIHIRRGDIAKKTKNAKRYNRPNSKTYHYMFWPIEYYFELIDTFKLSHPNVPIQVFTENAYADDVYQLNKYNNINLNFGTKRTIWSDFHELVSSKYLIPANSGFSYWAAYITKGNVIIPNRNIKQLHESYIWNGVN